MSNLAKPPMSVEDVTAKVTKERTFRKSDMQQKFLELVKAEVKILQDAYQNHRIKQVTYVMEERKKRSLKTDDLESDAFYPEQKMEE
jgi:dynactin complex subunit